MRRFLVFCAVLVLLAGMAAFAFAEASALGVSARDRTIRPGKSTVIGFTLPQAANVRITLESAEGELLSVVADSIDSAAGTFYLWWNGTYNGIFAPEGDALLVIRAGDETVSCPVTIGPIAPFITSVALSTSVIDENTPALTVTGVFSESGTLGASLALITENEEFTIAETESAADALSLTLTRGSALGETLAAGAYRLTLTLTDANGDVSDPVEIPFSVADPVTLPEASGELLTEEEALPDDAEDTVPADEALPAEEPAPEAAETPAPAGDVVEEHVELEDETVGDAMSGVALLDGNDQRQYTPSWGSPYTGQDTTLNYWTLPMDITDEAAVWQMLTEPITVLDTGAKKNAERVQVTLRKEPYDESDGVGVATCITQSVHVIRTEGDWTLIECYSASFHDSKVKNWNALVQGWVPTKYLKKVNPDTSMGLVVDKLTQSLYIFRDGHLFDTLLISTGKVNARQPYNETRSGEFLMVVPAVGGFQDGSMICSMAIRFDGGDLLHEVPHSLAKDGSKYYGTFEPSLGTKASHGCIRVQRHPTPKGVNMSWIWKNKKNRVKIVIWEDWQGRQIIPPADDTPLYYNAKGGKMYHSCETCNSAKGKKFTAFTYGELEDEAYRKLTRCPWCSPPLRLKDIAEINKQYLPGGDHEPLLTEARAKQGFSEE
ncbi:MAG: L,D-transpeptidase [Clostridia bacterium]|nr:L,D-transpeptidase [Clostridia bacterium]